MQTAQEPSPVRKYTIVELLDGRPKTWLAEKFGISHRTAWRWCTGETSPSAKQLIQLAELFGVDAASIDFGGAA